MVKWANILENWENGLKFKYPTQLKGRFQWNTSVLEKEGKSEYSHVFRTNKDLPTKQDKTAFMDKLNLSKDEDVTSFLNPSGDTILVVPMPRRGKNYVTLRDFVDNAPEEQQKNYWRHVAKKARWAMKNWGKVWISVHGLGVAYTHVRISKSPKYYFVGKYI